MKSGFAGSNKAALPACGWMICGSFIRKKTIADKEAATEELSMDSRRNTAGKFHDGKKALDSAQADADTITKFPGKRHTVSPCGYFPSFDEEGGSCCYDEIKTGPCCENKQGANSQFIQRRKYDSV